MRAARVFVATLLFLTLTTTPAKADHQINQWESSTETTAYYCCVPRHETGDTFRTYVGMTWSAAKAANQRGNQRNGIYFTIDQVDLNWNVDAFLWKANLPAPYLDRDDDNGDKKRDESELVSESTDFPVANKSYEYGVWWSHSYLDGSTWKYDSGGGTIGFWENLSTPGCPVFCDKYDTHCCNAQVDPQRNYPVNAQNAAAALEEAGPKEAAARDLSRLQRPIGEPFRLDEAVLNEGIYGATQGNEPNETHLQADLGRGLHAYAENARLLAAATALRGPSAGVVTFARPISWEQLVRLTQAGLKVSSVEFVSEPSADGLRWTFGGVYDPSLPRMVAAAAAEEEVDVLGIVAAEVVVPNARTLKAVQRSPDVFLVDLAITAFKRNNPNATDVSQNDLYWQLAGWD